MTNELLINTFEKVRGRTEEICSTLLIEDFSIQPAEFVSPPKWHLAHSTWFFEQFILVKYYKNYTVFNKDFGYLFNSYYNNHGEKLLRASRGLMTRPSVKTIYDYRHYVTQAIVQFFTNSKEQELFSILEIGIHHEQQHQELLIYDIKFILGHQVLFPQLEIKLADFNEIKESKYVEISEGIYTIGHQKDNIFSFDNELGVHKVFLHPFSISSTLVSNKEYIEFIEDGAYQNFNLWHAEGWDFICKHHINAPMYWHKVDGKWKYYTFEGLKSINLNHPVAHISYYEAFAFAQWRGLRLPTEFEWEIASKKINSGELWEWTASAYLPYPGFKKAEGALGEYNGKFMINQHVLRGGSIASPIGHIRNTYRNFFHPNLQWMYSGIRLVKDL